MKIAERAKDFAITTKTFVQEKSIGIANTTKTFVQEKSLDIMVKKNKHILILLTHHHLNYFNFILT